MALEADPPDPAAVQAARLALVEQWDGLAWQQANRWHQQQPWTDAADWHAAAVAGLWDAATRFKPEMGFAFSTYGSRYLMKWLRPYGFNEAAGGQHVPYHHGVKRVPVAAFGGIAGEDGEADFASSIPDRGDPHEAAREAEEFWEAVNRTVPDERERLILRRRFRDGKQLQEIGDELGITRERVRQIEGRALRRLKEQKDRFEGFMDDA